MNTNKYGPKLLDLKNWYEGWANRLAEQATLDSQSNYSFRLALTKLAAVEHNIKRLARGTFGRCEVCGGAIVEERLDILLDSECHQCATCATRPAGANHRRTSAMNILPARRPALPSAAPALAMS